jgi:hypothetical protein
MNQRLTHILVSIVATVLVVATLAFAFVVTAFSRSGAGLPLVRPAIPPVAHPSGGSMAACRRCHAAGKDGLPRGHRSYGEATCLTCHRLATVAAGETKPPRDEASRVPHGLALPYDDCVGCHAIGGNRSMPANHAEYANTECASCHEASPAASRSEP